MHDQAERTRRHTAAEVLRRIDDVTVASLSSCAESPAAIDARLRELDREWDTDLALEIEAATMGLVGLALGAFVRKQLLVLPAVVAGAVLTQSTTGHYPLMPLFRRLGLRTARQIERALLVAKKDAKEAPFAVLSGGSLLVDTNHHCIKDPKPEAISLRTGSSCKTVAEGPLPKPGGNE